MNAVHKSLFVLFPVMLFMLGACGTTKYAPANPAGFMSSYQDLERIDNPSGTPSWRWRSPAFSENDYHSLYIEPLIFYPEPESLDQQSKQALLDIRQSTDRLMRNLAEAQGVKVNKTKNDKTVVLRSAITTVDISSKDFSVKELIPLRLIFSAAELAMGQRDRDFVLLFEYELVDPVTGKVLVRGIRRAKGESLESEKQKLTIDKARPILENMVKDFEPNFKTLASRLNTK
jgi:hypothetical protein